MAEERRLVSVLFADIVGSTAMGAQHDPEVIRGTLSRTFARLSDVLTEHGGTVEKFIGDEVMAVFGVPAAHDDDADRAVRAAFALRDAIAQLNRAGGLQLDLRIGVNSGEVVAGTGAAGQFLVTGSAVNEAARLRAAAAPGEIVVGVLTRRLTQRGVRYEAARKIEAKGIGIIEASTALGLESALPEQRRGLEGMHAPLIGRDEELRLLLEAYRRSESDGRPYLATVFGTAGSGKSRLAEEFVSRVGREHIRYGRSLPYGQGITFYAVQSMLRADAGITPSDSREAAAAKLRSAVADLIGEASDDLEVVLRRVMVIAGLATADEVLGDVAPEDLTEELRWGIRRYVEGRAQHGPLVLLFEDIHWAEPGLLDLIEHLADRSRGPLFVLCLARPELLDARAAWGGGRTNATAISLEPLSADETRELIAALLAIDGLPEALRDEVVARAEGNPLYVEEFLRMLMETEQIERRDGRWVAKASLGALTLPPTLLGLIAARLDRLAPSTKRALQCAAVIGRFFSTVALAELLGGCPAEALADAIRLDLVVASDDRTVGGGRMQRFKHVLIRDVAYQAVPKSERSALHDRHGRWYETALGERKDELIEILAYHAEQAFLLARELDLPAAQELGARALGLLLPAATRARTRVDIAASASLYQRAVAVAEAIEAPERTQVECHGFAAMAEESMRPSAGTMRRIAELVPRARAAGPSEMFVRLLLYYAWDLGAGPETVPLYEEALSVARATGDPQVIAEALLRRRAPALKRGDLEATVAPTEEAIAYMRATGATEWLPQALSGRAMTHVQLGEFARARVLREEGLRIADAAGGRMGRINARGGLLNVERFRGALGPARAWAEQILALATETGSPNHIAWAHRIIADLDLRAGRAAEARTALEPILAGIDPDGNAEGWTGTASDLADACREVGDIASAERYATDAYRMRGRVFGLDAAITSVALARVRAAQGQGSEAERLFLEALAEPGVAQWGVMVTRFREQYGDFLLAQGRAPDAREQLSLALAFFSDPEAAPRRAEIEALLRRCDEAEDKTKNGAAGRAR